MRGAVFILNTFQFMNLMIKFDKIRAQTETPKYNDLIKPILYASGITHLKLV